MICDAFTTATCSSLVYQTQTHTDEPQLQTVSIWEEKSFLLQIHSGCRTRSSRRPPSSLRSQQVAFPLSSVRLYIRSAHSVLASCYSGEMVKTWAEGQAIDLEVCEPGNMIFYLMFQLKLDHTQLCCKKPLREVISVHIPSPTNSQHWSTLVSLNHELSLTLTK